jgi:hypothetical protein
MTWMLKSEFTEVMMKVELARFCSIRWYLLRLVESMNAAADTCDNVHIVNLIELALLTSSRLFLAQGQLMVGMLQMELHPREMTPGIVSLGFAT